jgi:hypothetical protein
VPVLFATTCTQTPPISVFSLLRYFNNINHLHWIRFSEVHYSVFIEFRSYKPNFQSSFGIAVERQKSKLKNPGVASHTVWPLKKSLTRRDKPKTPTVIHSPSGLRFLPLGKANVSTNILVNNFSPHDLCEENHERLGVARIQALFEAVGSPPERVKPCDVQKVINPLKLKKVCGIDGIPDECLWHLPWKQIVHLT